MPRVLNLSACCMGKTLLAVSFANHDNLDERTWPLPILQSACLNHQYPCMSLSVFRPLPSPLLSRRTLLPISFVTLMMGDRPTIWKLVENQIRILVDTNQVSRRKLVVRDQPDDGQKHSLTC